MDHRLLIHARLSLSVVFQGLYEPVFFFSNLSIVNVQLFLMVRNCWSAVNILFIMMPVVSLKILQCQCLYVCIYVSTIK